MLVRWLLVRGFLSNSLVLRLVGEGLTCFFVGVLFLFFCAWFVGVFMLLCFSINLMLCFGGEAFTASFLCDIFLLLGAWFVFSWIRSIVLKCFHYIHLDEESVPCCWKGSCRSGGNLRFLKVWPIAQEIGLSAFCSLRCRSKQDIFCLLFFA